MRARRTLALEEARLRAILDSELDCRAQMDAVRDADGVIIDFVIVDGNPAACRFHQMSRDDFVGSRLSALHAAAFTTGLFEMYRDVVESGEPLVLEDWAFPIQGLDLPVAYFDLTAARVGDGFSHMWRDVTEAHHIAEHLAASERRYRLLAENSSDLIVLADRGAVVEWLSPSSVEVLGEPPENLVGRSIAEIVHPDDLETVRLAGEAVNDGHPAGYTARFLTAERGWRWMGVTVRAVRDADGVVVGRVANLRDIQEQVEDRAALSRSERRFRLALESAPVGMAVVDLERNFVEVNPALCALLDRTPEWLLAHGLSDVLDPADDEIDRLVRADVLSGRSTSVTREKRLLRADGSIVWVQHSIGLLRHEGEPVSFVSQFVNVTEAKEAREDLLTLATHDSLTGLANRAAMLDEIARAQHSAERSGGFTGLAILDLDHFKYVNDSMGHAFGDELIRAAARRIEKVARAGDLVARLGGDEFVVVMRDLHDPTEAGRAAWRLVEAFRSPLYVGDNDVYASASAGVAVADAASGTADLLREADTALYVAKEQGRDRVSVFNEELRSAVTARVQTERQLRHAVDQSGLALWYQPEIELATGRITAVEALLRWHHPDGTVWTADRFIEVAEDAGLIVEIGAWVLREAFTQCARWAERQDGVALTVRVNLSAHQLNEPGLLEAFEREIASSGVDPTLLCVEITETVLLRETETVRANLAGIHALGVRIAADDFGTGYASLAYLRSYPIDVVKIDRSFVSDITTSPVDEHLVEGVVALADRLGMTVTAEGVETAEQALTVHRLGCTGAQGWLYSKAVPAEEITERWLGGSLAP